MGFFDAVLKGFGFEGEESSEDRVIIRPRRTSDTTRPKKRYERFNLHNRKVNTRVLAGQPQKANEANNLVIYAPKTHEDVQAVVECLKKEESCIVNLEDIGEEDSSRVLDFLSGAIFAIDGQISRIQGDLFLITPKGVNIKMGEIN